MPLKGRLIPILICDINTLVINVSIQFAAFIPADYVIIEGLEWLGVKNKRHKVNFKLKGGAVVLRQPRLTRPRACYLMTFMTIGSTAFIQNGSMRFVTSSSDFLIAICCGQLFSHFPHLMQVDGE